MASRKRARAPTDGTASAPAPAAAAPAPAPPAPASSGDAAALLARTVYLDGLPYTATEDDIVTFCSAVGRVQAVRAPRWQDSGRLRGYAHVEFASPAEAAAAVARLSGKHLGARYVTVAAAKPPASAGGAGGGAAGAGAGAGGAPRARPKGCATLFARGLPYDADEAAVAAAFSRFGAVASVRLARNSVTGAPKGFGYVTFDNALAAEALMAHFHRPAGAGGAGAGAAPLAVGDRRVTGLDYDEGAPKASFRAADGRPWAKAEAPAVVAAVVAASGARGAGAGGGGGGRRDAGVVPQAGDGEPAPRAKKAKYAKRKAAAKAGADASGAQGGDIRSLARRRRATLALACIRRHAARARAAPVRVAVPFGRSARAGVPRLLSSASSAAVSAPPRAPAPAAPVVTALGTVLANVASLSDAEDLALAYGLAPHALPAPVARLAVVKVGGEVVAYHLPALLASLRALVAAGLAPVVIHGGGPQLNDELAKAGVQPTYIGGHRVTDAATLLVAERVFHAANDELCAALAGAGLPPAPFKGGVFAARVTRAELGLVGAITAVPGLAAVSATVAAGRVPVLTSLGFDATPGGPRAGAPLNINADVAARELAIGLRPARVAFVSAGGGWKEGGRVVEEIDMANDFARLEAMDYTGRQGTLLKLREMKAIVDALPPAASVAITSPEGLGGQLVPHRGPGTQIRAGVRLHAFDSVGAADAHALLAHLRAAGPPGARGLAAVLAALNRGGGGGGAGGAAAAAAAASPFNRRAAGARVIATADYGAAAVLLPPAAPGAPLELASLTLTAAALAEGVGGALWKAVKAAAVAASAPSPVDGAVGSVGLAWATEPAPPGGAPARLAAVAKGGAAAVPGAFPALAAARSAHHATASIAPGDATQAGGAAGASVWLPPPARAADALAALAAALPGLEQTAAAAAAAGAVSAPPPSSSSSSPSPGVAAAHVATAAAAASPASAAPAPPSPAAPAKTASTPGVTRVGLLGARGFVGRELLKLFASHPRLLVVAAGSRALRGQPVADALGVPDARLAVAEGTVFENYDEAALRARAHPRVDAWVLALPNGLAGGAAAAIEAAAAAAGERAPLLIDVSADFRFDATREWVYGLPERPGARALLARARKISNPGCYATGAQAALLPLLRSSLGLTSRGERTPPAPALDALVWDAGAAPPAVFGVSGYSGAGTSPSEKNDPAVLRDNLLAYSLVNHIHEREVGRHCGLDGVAGRGAGVAFMPHVAPFFQGIHLTVTGTLAAPPRGGAGAGAAVTAGAIAERYAAFYAGERLVRVVPHGPDAAKAGAPPDVARDGARRHGVVVGGVAYDPAARRVALVATIDNLLKGAATQCVQNMNIALGEDEYAGIPLG